ncbi:DMT family transporter [Microbacterium sp. ZXX196]|uniref:DMT family transporter n=1 Tax=Microbacterium sp. ZXX196 TaxID=2609291 RepID=UPI0012B865C3|nr:DMT family transporter [Microbacterium sp. ZXX196]MTE23835.1 multidrug DMT transporter permease [Microbacterium sp. ZXX196]
MTQIASAGVSTDEIVGLFDNPALLLGIPLAIAGAVFMSLGAQFQSQGVRKVERLSGSSGRSGLAGGHVLSLVRRPSWLIGTALLGAAILCQLSALAVAPLIVVQPLGAISLVITTLLNAQATGHTPTRASLTSIGLCIGGIFVFVLFAALYAVETPLEERQLFVLLAILLVVLIVVGAAWLVFRQRAGALFYISAAGVLYGFVATLAKVVIKRFQAADIDFATIACLIALVAAAAAGAYFVQTAYSAGPPDLVIAGLTVIDPIVAVIIGASLLGEAANTPVWTLIVWVVAGGVAAVGVVMLARSHPQVISESQELPITRGSGPDPETPPESR